MAKNNSTKPPGFAIWILCLLFPAGKREMILRDLKERFEIIAEDEGLSRAKIWYLIQILMTLLI